MMLCSIRRAFHSGYQEHKLFPALCECQGCFCLLLSTGSFPCFGAFPQMHVQISTQRPDRIPYRNPGFSVQLPLVWYFAQQTLVVLASLNSKLCLLSETTGLFLPPYTAAWKLSAGNKLKQSQDSSCLSPFCQESLSFTAYHPMSENLHFPHSVQLGSCLRWEGKSGLLLCYDWKWKSTEITTANCWSVSFQIFNADQIIL